MNRIKFVLALAICFTTTLTTAQNSGHATLADRIESLRDGWGSVPSVDLPEDSAEAPAELKVPKQSTTKQSPAKRPEKLAKLEPKPYQPAQSKTQARAESKKQLPRVNPRDLLPRSWRLAGEKPSESLISEDEQPPIPRAGSVISNNTAKGPSNKVDNQPNRSQAVALSPTNRSQKRRSWAASALSRSIAEEVAQSLGPENARPIEEANNETNELESTEEVIAEETHSEDALEPIASQEVAKEISNTKTTADPIAKRARPFSAKVVAQQNTAEHVTKLPMTIGSEKTKQPSTVFNTKSNSLAKSYQADMVSDDDDQLLITQKMPIITYQVAGPRKIIVGREAIYRVTLDNRGDAAADQLDATISIPGWAEVVGVSSPTGIVDQQTISEQPREVFWSINRLAGSQKATLDLKLIARVGRPIELGVQWKHSPVAGRTMVEVQEPKIELKLTGPDEVLFGKQRTFRLTISNPGTGPADNVALKLTQQGSEGAEIKELPIGSLAASERRSVDIELTAREAGPLSVLATATADGDLKADIIKEFLCRKAELAVEWRGPAERYSGALTTYFLRVRNPGTAVAQNVVLNAKLPMGFEVVNSEGANVGEDGIVRFQAGSLRPGDESYFELKGIPTASGTNKLDLYAEAADDIRSEVTTAMTEVITLADLKLDVQDPKGPVATGEEIEYQIRVTNRGSNTANAVKIVGLFSNGIEPHHTVGATSSIADGRVEFETIGSIAAGTERTVTIRARAHDAGTHLFRAEVICQELETKLAAEETTLFFEDESTDIATKPGERYGY